MIYTNQCSDLNTTTSCNSNTDNIDFDAVILPGGNGSSDSCENINQSKKDIFCAFLSILDNMEKTFGYVTSQEIHFVYLKERALLRGIRNIMQQFNDTFNKFGIRKMILENQFDPKFHDAIKQVSNRNGNPGSIFAEVDSGYMLGDDVLRPAKVVVVHKS
jgi:molecular chaperone GrpE